MRTEAGVFNQAAQAQSVQQEPEIISINAFEMCEQIEISLLILVNICSGM